jgi:transposase-like protein
LNKTNGEVSCKFCHSTNTIKYGNFKNIQRRWCKACNRKYAFNQAWPRMKVDFDIASSAVVSYFQGISLNTITQDIADKYKIEVSVSTVFRWIYKFIQFACRENSDRQPKVGDIWIINRTGVNIQGTDYYLSDIIDHETQFMIATSLFEEHNKNRFDLLITKAGLKIDRLPQKIIVVNNGESLNQNEIEFGAYKREIIFIFGTEEESRELLDLIKNSFMIRNYLLRKLRKQDNITAIIEGWLVHYNYYGVTRSSHILTPGRRAGIAVDLPPKEMPIFDLS